MKIRLSVLISVLFVSGCVSMDKFNRLNSKVDAITSILRRDIDLTSQLAKATSLGFTQYDNFVTTTSAALINLNERVLNLEAKSSRKK